VTIQEALRHGAALLEAAGIDNPQLDARLLLGHTTGLSREALLREPLRAIDPTPYHALLARRAAREPLALILGRQAFWSLDFALTRDTLDPRPDSETLIEAAITPRTRAIFPVHYAGVACERLERRRHASNVGVFHPIVAIEHVDLAGDLLLGNILL